MSKQSTIQHYFSLTPAGVPAGAGMTYGEIAINVADEKLFIENLNGGVISLSQTKDLSGAFAHSDQVVTSVNGATGNIVSIATTGSNVFTGLNTFNAGLSAANLFVSGGATFGTSVSISGGTAWHANNDGKGSGLDADFLRGINGDRYLEEIQTGLLYGGVLSINAGNTGFFNVSAGAGIVITVNASLTGLPAPTLTNVTWNSFTGQSVLGLTSGDFTFVRIDSSGNLQQSTSDFTQPEYLNSVVLGNIVHPSRSHIDRVHSHPIVAYASSAQYEAFIRFFGPLKVSGYAMSGFGTTGQVQVSSGVAYALGANMETDPNNPSVVTDSASVPLSTFYYLYRNADGSYKTDPTTSTIVSFNKYDDGDGTLGTISNNNWSIQRVYKIPGTDVVYVYYGRNSYSTSTTATAAILTESFNEADITLKNGVFLGWLIVRGGGSNVSSTGDCVIVPGGFFRNTTGGGGAATVSSLDDLSDVTITSPSSNQILRYDGTQGLWVNSAVTTLPLVTSINGATGAITNVAFTNIEQTFTGLQTFANGISGAGATFASDITINGIRVGKGAAGDLNSIVVGMSACPAGTFNVAIGREAMRDSVSAINNVAIGYHAARDIQGGINNVAIGANALDENENGSVNVAIGYLALSESTNSNQNTAIGSSSLQNTTTGFRNVAIGYQALEKNSSGVANVAIGHAAGAYRGDLDILYPNDLDNEEPNVIFNRTTGTGGIYIGQWSRASANGQTNEIVIGTNAVGLGSNTAVIGATGQVSATIYGTLNLPGGLSASSGATFAGTVSSDTGYRISSSAINTQTGATYSLLSTDNGEILTFNNGSAVTVTIPTGLPVGFNCTAIQLGAGQVGFTAAAGVTLNSYGGLLKLAGQHGAATIISYSSNIYNIAGTLST